MTPMVCAWASSFNTVAAFMISAALTSWSPVYPSIESVICCTIEISIPAGEHPVPVPEESATAPLTAMTALTVVNAATLSAPTTAP